MRLKIIGSNSDGNAYLLESKAGTLLIDCGVSFMKIKRALNFQIGNVSAIVSHSHGDHCKSMKDVMNAGIKVFASEATLEARGLSNHHRAVIIEAGTNYMLGDFRVRPFSVNHDVPCFGFLISHPEMGRCVFLSDTYYSDYVFPEVNHFIVECNHAMDIIDTNSTPRFLRDRVIQSHMNLDTCIEFLLANDLSGVNNIVLIHLSDDNSDARRFKSEVELQTGKTVHIAEEGLIIENFHKNPF